VRITADSLAQKSRIERHRAIHSALGDDLIARIQANGDDDLVVSGYGASYGQLLKQMREQQLSARLAPWLAPFERSTPFRELEVAEVEQHPSLLLIGLGRFGTALADALHEAGCEPAALDLDPETVRRFAANGGVARYGDATDQELLASLPLSETAWVVSTLRDPAASMALLTALKDLQYPGRIAVSAGGSEEAGRLERAGADLVLIPYTHAARDAATRLLATPGAVPQTSGFNA